MRKWIHDNSWSKTRIMSPLNWGHFWDAFIYGFDKWIQIILKLHNALVEVEKEKVIKFPEKSRKIKYKNKLLKMLKFRKI